MTSTTIVVKGMTLNDVLGRASAELSDFFGDRDWSITDVDAEFQAVEIGDYRDPFALAGHWVATIRAAKP